MEKIRISIAKPEDALGITTVLYKTWLATYPNEEIGITKEDVEDSYKDSFTEESIQKQQENLAKVRENMKRVVAKAQNQVVGMATMLKNEDNNQLRTIYVLPEYQGKGVGKMLWNEVKDFVDLSKDTIVQVATYNQSAIEFYKKLGFVDTGKRWKDEKLTMKNGSIIPQLEMKRELEDKI